AQGVLGHDVRHHVTDLAHEVDGFVEGDDKITLGQLDLLADLRHRPAPAPVQRRTVEARVVALADEELEVALLAKDLVLEVLETPAHGDQPLWQRETVGVAEFPIEAEPREDLRDL